MGDAFSTDWLSVGTQGPREKEDGDRSRRRLKLQKASLEARTKKQRSICITANNDCRSTSRCRVMEAHRTLVLDYAPYLAW